MENFSFTKQEMAAVIKMAQEMMKIDGNIHQNELDMMCAEFYRFNLSPKDTENLLDIALSMKDDVAIATIAVMTDAQKRYVTAYLGTMMAADGNIDDKERTLWSFISLICHLPEMTIEQAIDYMAN